MKKSFLLLFLILFLAVTSYAQVTNLLVNGVSSNFTSVSGSQFGWSYDVPTAGDTTYLQIWMDTDNNGLLNPSIDVLWSSYMQIDGDPRGQNGPPDVDGTANGHVVFQQNIGLAPAHYIMYFKNNNAISLVAGEITALSSPTFTISGSVGGLKNVVVNLKNESGQNFWTGITDASGNYSIEMDSDTTGNPWSLTIDNTIIFRPDVSTPELYNFTIDPGIATTYTNKSFTITAAAAHISGNVSINNTIPFKEMSVYITADNGNFSRISRADTNGNYDIGLTASELPKTNLGIGAADPNDTTIVPAFYNFSVVNSGDHFTRNLDVFSVNSTISGRVTVDGNSPTQNIDVYVYNRDSVMVHTATGIDGYFRSNVTDKIYNYNIQLLNYPPNYTFNNLLVHPGDTNVNINLTPTDVKKIDSSVPANFSLAQNYPNPFNPSTKIIYEIPKQSLVTLTIFNILGQEMANLVNQVQGPGKYSVDFNAAGLSSGIYFYKIQAGDFVSFKKMILEK